jgi:putative flippase GtrA
VKNVVGVLARLGRSGAAGLVATLADLAMLTGLTELAGASPRVASVPALVTGGLVMFFGQKYFAFRGSGKPKTRELVEFGLVQAGGLMLTGFLYDVALRSAPFLTTHYVLVRLVATNLVWLGYSFPLWHLVFRERSGTPARERDARPGTRSTTGR